MRYTRFRRRGVASPVAVILMTSILAVGAVVGLVMLRDHLVRQFGDVSEALDHIDQSYAYEIFIDGERSNVSFGDCYLERTFIDVPDLPAPLDAPAGINLQDPPVDEG